MDKRGSSVSGSHRSRSASSPASSALQAPPPRPTELSPMARNAAAAAAFPRAPGLLRAALLLLLLLPSCRHAAGAPVASELRCQCLKTLQKIHPKHIQSVTVTRPGASCDQTEVIATLKNGQEACLNPETPFVKTMIEKMLNKGSTN